MYSLKVNANTPGYLKKVISDDKYNSLSARDQQFYSKERPTVREPEMTTVVAKGLLGEDELRTVDRNTCDERNL